MDPNPNYNYTLRHPSGSTPPLYSQYQTTGDQPQPASSEWPTNNKAAIDQDAKIRNAATQARHRQKRKAHIAQVLFPF
ncbi:hypothetical protein FRB94_005875 [Tulasnella sp. JGI-2019a]|nr:hypothetical protein FRB93_006362 [Tulasnella sp. JGI-2019a]KAG8999850.1 hypothetical protein FRB94_005875 [Tulasnella sp. JGI-2019a]KAG9027813.1 hypothetical protein FRB95_007358 [Tulasnella sp. JGI-2019a]